MCRELRTESAQCTNWNWCNTYRSKLHTSNWHNIAAKHLLYIWNATFLIMHETFRFFLFQVVSRTESVFFSTHRHHSLQCNIHNSEIIASFSTHFSILKVDRNLKWIHKGFGICISAYFQNKRNERKRKLILHMKLMSWKMLNEWRVYFNARSSYCVLVHDLKCNTYIYFSALTYAFFRRVFFHCRKRKIEGNQDERAKCTMKWLEWTCDLWQLNKNQCFF